jgi:Protein of unknown function (DUF3800)
MGFRPDRLSFFGCGMYLLYLDDAGSVSNNSDTHIVLAGIALFERQVHFLDQLLGGLASEIAPQSPNELEFHANHMLAGKGFWRSIQDRNQRRRHLAAALSKADGLHGKWALFGAVVEKQAVSPNDALEYAFEQIINRFDRFLGRMHKRNNTQRGLLILDKSTRETRLQGLTQDFRLNGHRWGRLNNLVDVPFFVDSKATRSIQYADMVAHALWRHHEKGDSEFFNIIETAFDREGGVRHGLHVMQLTPAPVPHS